MTERGLPIVGGAPACPFVAFDDDRDERGTSPDHRHRCYAEAEPAPRALAHQEAYCLSSAFPVCPTFQDWARREAARARPPDVPPVESDDESPDTDYPPLVSDRPPRRDDRGAWAAPPPWLRGAPGQAAPGQAVPGQLPLDVSAEGPAPATQPPAKATGAAAAAAGGLSGSFADRMTSGTDPAAGPAAGTDAGSADQPRGEPPSGEPGGPEPDTRPEPQHAASEDVPSGAAPARPARRRDRLDSGSDRIEAGHDVDAPSWERPRRLEAYPTLRSRRLPAALVSPLLIGIAAVVLAAGALFVLPTLLGIGGPPAASPSQSATATVVPSESLEPSALPGPTPFTYTVQQGDTLTKIAKKFGVSLADLIAANKDTHPNPDVLSVGDQLIIPITTPTEIPGASLEASPSP